MENSAFIHEEKKTHSPSYGMNPKKYSWWEKILFGLVQFSFKLFNSQAGHKYQT